MNITLDTSLADLFPGRRKQIAEATTLPPIGTLRIPQWAETTHIAIRGPSGVGKTNVIHWLMEGIIARGDSGLFVDPKGSLMKAHYQEGDEIFNVFDVRSVRWSLLAEIKTLADVETIVNCVIPDSSGTTHDSTWDEDCRTFLAPMLAGLHKAGRTNPREILHLASVATPQELKATGYWDGTPAEIWFDPDNPRYFASIRGTLAKRLKFLQYDFKDTSKPLFSIRDFVRSLPARGPNGKRLWLPFPELQQEALKPMFSIFIGLFFTEMMARPLDLSARIWAELDEATALGDIYKFARAFAAGREYGLGLIICFQNDSQMHEVYGEKRTTSIMSNCNTKVIFRPADPKTADNDSESLGHFSARRWTRGASDSSGVAKSTSDGLTEQFIPKENSVPVSELETIPNLTAYIKIQELPPALLVMPYYDKKLDNPPEFYIPYQDPPADDPSAEDAQPAGTGGEAVSGRANGTPEDGGIDFNYVDTDGVIRDEPQHAFNEQDNVDAFYASHENADTAIDRRSHRDDTSIGL